MLPKTVTVRPFYIFRGTLSFLDAYNALLKDEEINGLASEMNMCHIAQRTYYLWLETLQELLVEVGVIEADKEADVLMTEHITMETLDAYISAKRFIDRYNRYLKDSSINALVAEMQQPHIAKRTYLLWQECLRKILLEAEEAKQSQ